MPESETPDRQTAGQTAVPRHVAIIMDGNGRWAKKRHLPRHAGHKAGVGAVRMAVERCARAGVEVLTLFAFSSENWRRPKQEVGLLMELFMTALHREVRRLTSNDVRLRVIGDRTALPEKLQSRIARVEALTEANSGLVLQIAANYGGRWDLAQAARRLSARVLAGELRPEDIDEPNLAAELSFADLPDPDLFIRTGGELRLSNFLLWQAAYSELYFTDCLWPDFDQAQLQAAFDAFAHRERRFGKIGEQLSADTSEVGGG